MAPQMKGPSQPLARLEGIVPTDEEKNMTTLPRVPDTVEADVQIATCDACGTVRSTKQRRTEIYLRCVSCKRTTNHRQPYSGNDVREAVNARQSGDLVKLMREVESFERLNVAVDLEAHRVEQGTAILRWYDDGAVKIGVQHDLPISVKLDLLKRIWKWLPAYAEYAREPKWRPKGADFIGVVATRETWIDLELAVHRARIDKAVGEMSL